MGAGPRWYFDFERLSFHVPTVPGFICADAACDVATTRANRKETMAAAHSGDALLNFIGISFGFPTVGVYTLPLGVGARLKSNFSLRPAAGGPDGRSK